MKKPALSLCTASGAWLSLVAAIVGTMALQRVVEADALRSWDEARGERYLAGQPSQMNEQQGYQSRQAQLAVEQRGRRGVTEQPGRRGVTESPGRPGADPGTPGREPTPPDRRLRPIIVEATLNRHITVPLVLDTGATYTVLTRQTAHALGIKDLNRLPKQQFLTANGSILSPVTTLKSVRVGTAEAEDVEVAIDVDGHLPMGLLGMTFMRHFTVTVDQEQGRVKFERR